MLSVRETDRHMPFYLASCIVGTAIVKNEEDEPVEGRLRVYRVVEGKLLLEAENVIKV